METANSHSSGPSDVGGDSQSAYWLSPNVVAAEASGKDQASVMMYVS
jgi:hypothetical protein